MTRREIVALALAVVVTWPIVTKRIYASDEIQYFAYLRSLWFDRDVSFDNEYRALVAAGAAAGSGFVETNLSDVTDTGLRKNFGTIGSAMLWLPFYAAGDLTARVMRASGSAVAVDGYSKPYVAAVCLGSAFYAMAALFLSAAVARSLTGRGGLAALAVGIGTPLVFYAFVAPVFAHACSAFAVSLFVFTWLRVRAAWSARGLLILGGAAALMAMVREQDAFLVIGPAIDALWSFARPAPGAARRPTIAAMAAGVAAGAVAYLPQVLAYLALYGRFGPAKEVTRKMSWHAPHALEVLASPAHGFFMWTPLAAIAIGGLVWLAWRRPAGSASAVAADLGRLGICFVAMVASQVYVAGSVESWTVAGAFGQRRFVALTPLLVVGLAGLFTWARQWQPAARRVLGTAVAVGIWWNLGLMAQYGLHRMDRQRLTLAENAWTTFVELPLEAPGLAWRYLTDRASFYRQPRQ